MTVICIYIFLYMHICDMKAERVLLSENKGSSQKGKKDEKGKEGAYIS